jgi:hypothetical protein
VKDSGVVYIAFGERYAAETRRSLASLRLVTEASVAVVTDQPWKSDPQPDMFVLRPAERSFRCKPLHLYDASPFTRTLFLDTDTVIARDIAPVFGLLEHFDVAVNFAGAPLNHPGGLEFHLQCSSGVILFRKGPTVEHLFTEWLHLYDEACKQTSSTDERGVGDQRYLAIAIAESVARPAHLGSFLNFAITDVMVTNSPPAVYHGRKAWLEKVGSQMNRTWDPASDWYTRVWMPNAAGFLPRGVRRSDPLLAMALILRRFWNELQRRSSAR